MPAPLLSRVRLLIDAEVVRNEQVPNHFRSFEDAVLSVEKECMTVSSKVRIYDLAKELKLDTKRLIEEVRREGVDVSVPSNSVSKELAEKIRNKYFPKKETAVKRSVKVVKRATAPLPELPALDSRLLDPIGAAETLIELAAVEDVLQFDLVVGRAFAGFARHGLDRSPERAIVLDHHARPDVAATDLGHDMFQMRELLARRCPDAVTSVKA